MVILHVISAERKMNIVLTALRGNMSNQLEYEIGVDRVRVYLELAKHALRTTEKQLEDTEIQIDFDSNRSSMFVNLIDKKVFFSCFTGGGTEYCNIYYIENQLKRECRHVPTELITFKEY